MRLVVDANIVFDLQAGGISEKFRSLGFDCVIPDLVFYEEMDPESQSSASWMKVREYSMEELLQASELEENHPKLSLHDCLCLLTALTEERAIATGDGGLRRVASKQGIVVVGQIRLLDAMLEQQVITTTEACIALEGMLSQDRRLPRAVVEQRKSEWDCE